MAFDLITFGKVSLLAFRGADIIQTLFPSFVLDISHLKPRVECDSRGKIVPFDALLGFRKACGNTLQVGRLERLFHMIGAEFVDCVRYILNGDETDGELAIGIDSGKRILIRITTA